MSLVYIYGAGKYGTLLYQWCQKNEICEIAGFVQTTGNLEKRMCEGLPLYGIEEVPQRTNATFLIALADRDVVREIKTMLICVFDVVETAIVDCAEFITDNLVNSGSKYCLVCGSHVEEFEPRTVDGELLYQKHHIIGGGYRENCVCPKCKSLDRTRWLFYVLRRFTPVFDSAIEVLHFAPEKKIVERIRKYNKNCRYVTADLQCGRADVVVDMTDVPFEDKKFDIIIANHVLEHIKDEEKAVEELKRTLKDDGEILLSFPICMDMDTYENDKIVTNEERLLKYGQVDHVRLYGKDYKQRLEQYGLQVEVYSPNSIVSKEIIRNYGFISDDIILCCKKSV